MDRARTRNSTTRKAFAGCAAVALLVLGALCCSVAAQENDRATTVRDDSRQSRVPELSDLARQNLNRVAASAADIQQVLVKDPGLFVELKRIIAKETTDNGQLVQDSDLTEQAIFDRLARDVAFRSVATRLLQRYGYLLPAVNPDSDLGKQQELVLKERARQLVQIEAQEDSRLANQQQQASQPGEIESCDTRAETACEQPLTRAGQRVRTPGGAPEGAEPLTSPSNEIPEGYPPAPSLNQQRTLRAGSQARQEDGFIDGEAVSSMKTADLVSASSRSSSGNVSPLGPGVSGFPIGPATDGLVSPPTRGRTQSSDLTSFSAISSAKIPPSSGARGSTMEPEPSVVMVHKANPYLDIPSLYDMYVQASARQRKPERFGVDVFRNRLSDSNAIPMDLPVGPDYVVGPGDALAIDLWGGVSQRLFRVVDREGRVSLPEVGPVLVSGKSLSGLQQSVQQLFRTQFRDVSADVSLSRLRTVRVYVVGDVAEPGAYDVSSLSTPLNAIFAAGGVKPQASLRRLKHYRGKELVEEVDAYDLLLNGVRGDLKRLENGDTLLVPPIGPQVTIDGMVRRPAVYELRNETSLAEALELAGGILPTATLRNIEVQRVEEHQKRTMLKVELPRDGGSDAIDKQLRSFKVHDGDEIHIFPIAPYNENGIYLQGHVLRPGRYSFRDGMKLADVIASYSDLLPEPAAHYAEIIRLNAPDYHPSVESFDLSAALQNPATAPRLQPLDTVRIFSRYDFEPAPVISVGGEVRAPGQYRTSGQAHLRDAIYQAGGVSADAALDSAQLFRTQTDGTMKILSVNLAEALAGNPVDNLLLQPRDRILVNRNLAQVDPPTVYIKGEVAKPGRYPLTNNMRVEDLVRVAGGLKRSAYADSADLTHVYVNDKQREVGDHVEVNLAAVLTGDTSNDLPLRNGDVLTIRQVPGWNDLGASVTVRGEVQHPGSYGIKPGEKLSSVLERAGGFSPEAYPYGAVLMRAEVRELEMKNHTQLVQRVKAEQIYLRALPESEPDQKNAKLTAIAQTETTLNELQSNLPVGRVVIHIQPTAKSWRNTAADVPVRDGDILVIPKKANYITIGGQVFNPTAVGYQPGRSAKWYLSQAGGLTALADKKGVFVVRADGSVIAAKNNSSGWLLSGDPLGATLRPGDSIVVPERTPKIGSRNWAPVMQTAQLASSLALAVAYIHP